MLDHIEQLFVRYRTRGVLLDTNLLLLYVVGLLDQRQITSFKRTNIYERDDFELLARVVEHFDVVVTTPHVLTETSNFLGQLPGPLSEQGQVVLGEVVPALREKQRPSSVLTGHARFRQFGLTDAAIADVSAGTHLVLTDDLPLYHVLSGTGQEAINFSQLRMANW